MPKGRTKQGAKPRKLDERYLLLLGLFVVFASVYLLLAFISHLFTWSADQSLGWQNIFMPFGVSAENIAGPLGAAVAGVFVNQGIGIAAFGIPALLFFYGLRILRVQIRYWRRRQLYAYVGMPLASVLLGYLFGTAGGYLVNGPGGQYGYYVAEWLNHLVSPVGTGLILALLTVGYLMWLNRKVEAKIRGLLERAVQKLRNPNLRMAGAGEAEAESGDTPPEFDGESFVGDDDEKPQPSRSEAAPAPAADSPVKPADAQNEKGKTNAGAHADQSGVRFTIERPSGMPSDELPAASGSAGLQGSSGRVGAQPTPAQEAPPLVVVRSEGDTGRVEHIGIDQPYDPTLDLPGYQTPSLDLLDAHDEEQGVVTQEELYKNNDTIIATLRNYSIEISDIKATVGPTVTLYEIVPAPGVRISKIKNLEDDIALSLSALGIRIIAPMPGQGTIGIEVPNAKPGVVSMLSVLSSTEFQQSKFELPVALGKTISDKVFVADLTKMPHLLVAGATGQGKSVGLNAILASLLYRKHPSQLKLVLVDPKKVELSLYAKIENHFLAKLPDAEEAIITDTERVINTLNSLCVEMDARYDLLKMAEVRNIKEYNAKFIARRLNPEKGHRFLPYIVVVIDEFADLIMTAGREIELPISRIAQLARAIGIHLIIATQRPTTNIITGLIKANFPERIAFKVTSVIDSRTILDSPGANQLIGRGDMLVSNGSEMVRVQCAFLDTPELARITDFIGNQPSYGTPLLLPEYSSNDGAGGASGATLDDLDPLFADVARFVVEEGRCSTSSIQRKYSIGYNRAGRIVDQLELAGIVGAQDASKPRQVLVQDFNTLEGILSSLGAR